MARAIDSLCSLWQREPIQSSVDVFQSRCKTSEYDLQVDHLLIHLTKICWAPAVALDYGHKWAKQLPLLVSRESLRQHDNQRDTHPTKTMLTLVCFGEWHKEDHLLNPHRFVVVFETFLLMQFAIIEKTSHTQVQRYTWVDSHCISICNNNGK